MFTTFSAQMSPVLPSTSTTPPNGANGKRRKVARACDSCRLNRVRCDDNRPCENCRARGDKCTNTMPWEAHSLPAAKREIERLQDRLNQLQRKQLTNRSNASSPSPSPPTPPDVSVNGGSSRPILPQQSNNQSVPISTNDNTGQAIRGQDNLWEGYSNSSSSSVTPALVYSAGYHTEPDQPSSEQGKSASDKRNESQTTFSRSKERQFLSLFWKGYPWLHPVLDRDDIYHHHDSLWNEIPPGEQQTRLPSALVDVLLALSMQYGSTFLLRDSSDSTQWSMNSRSGNASLAGQSFCQRSHRLHLERPHSATLESVQCCILSSVYFLNAGSLDKANMALAEGIRMAQILGLHEPSPSTSSDLKQGRLRSNIWRLLIVLDGHFAILLGLPPLIQPIAEERLVMDFWQCTALDEPNNDHDQSRAWESYHIHHMNLTLAAHAVHAHFLRRKGELLRQGYGGGLQSPIILESFADSMNQKLDVMKKWTETVPPALTIPRPGGGGPFSVVWASVLDFDPQTPLHIQQQRLSLELIYHHLTLLLVRAFVRFVHRYQDFPRTKQADVLFVRGLKHAISIISIMNQALTNEDAITGWLFFFGCQWDATLYLLNYITSYPTGSFVGDTRRSLGTATETLALMGKYLDVAKSAQGIVQGALGRDAPHATTELNTPPPNDPRAFDSMGSVATASASPLLSFVDEEMAEPWNYYRTLLVPTSEFSWGSAASAVQPDPFGPLNTPRTAPDSTSLTDPFLLDSTLNQSPLVHRGFDNMVEMYSFLGDWQPVRFGS
ncbi:hypothetical protein F5Y10DRAFT_285374 [Nemania abortiva]|nr:hypothetical protein F5Y10DRAFT_285374 [Nemania abortiva]